MDDPLSLLAFAVWTMALGMYPLGFMFGGCSPCCCPPCDESKCKQAYESLEEGPCQELPDSVVVETEFESKTFTTDGEFFVGGGFVKLSETTETPCIFPPELENRVLYLAVQLGVYQANIAPTDQCGCPQCVYLIEFRFFLAQHYSFLGQEFVESINDKFVEFFLEVPFDKCTQETSSLEVVVTKEQIEQAYSLQDDLQIDCPGSQEFFFDIEEVRFTFDFNLDDPCECGACCRDGVCSENELQSYCEQNTVWFGDLGDGVWQGVGTDCDPNPCPEPE